MMMIQKNKLLISKKLNTSNDLNNIKNNNTANDKINSNMIEKESVNDTSNKTSGNIKTCFPTKPTKPTTNEAFITPAEKHLSH